MARRSLTDSTDLAYSYVFGPLETTFEEMVAVVGVRWTIEAALEETKGDVGLDQDDVRRWNSWYRPMTLALMAHAFLTVTRAQAVRKGVA